MILYEEASKSKDYCEVESLPCGVIQALHGGHSTISSSFFFCQKETVQFEFVMLVETVQFEFVMFVGRMQQ